MYDLKPVPEDEPVYGDPVCGKQNLDKSGMIFQVTGATNRMRPFMCRECSALRKEAEWQERQRQKQKEQEQAEALKAHRQAIHRQLMHESARLPTTPSDPSPEGNTHNEKNPP